MNTHQFSSLLVLIFTCHFAAVSALVTPKTIEIMTVKMDISIGAITKYVDVDKDKDEEIEYKNTGSLIAGALSEIVLLLKSELNEPMIGVRGSVCYVNIYCYVPIISNTVF
ncbi:hypothetical protein GcM3_109026 [Golovinomyces cichoracearum]|uniref:Uncharacterized protein n=1 Tax=Golovinomyces cichoracearum TaxID=62708 RepID=A0A420I9A2_9PEZI|nr:hypothetical protein GcM3_109026 [Golovinomyces cichoracearum]